MIGYGTIKKPHYVHNCVECEYMFTIQDTRENYVDVYRQCQSITSSDALLLRYGPEDSDYVSSVTMDSLIMGYMMSHFAKWKDHKECE